MARRGAFPFESDIGAASQTSVHTEPQPCRVEAEGRHARAGQKCKGNERKIMPSLLRAGEPRSVRAVALNSVASGATLRTTKDGICCDS